MYNNRVEGNKYNPTNNMSNTIRFKTVMVTDDNRKAFTALRDSLKTEELGRVSDKELFEAMFSNAATTVIAKTVLAAKQAGKVAANRQKIQKLEKELFLKSNGTQF